MLRPLALLAVVPLLPLASRASEADPGEARETERAALPAPVPAPSDGAESRGEPAGSLRAVPLRIPFQGFLRDTGGQPIDAPVSLDVALYSAEVGGVVQWGPESHPAVPVDEGIFRISLGSTVALPTGIFDGSPLWLGVSVDGEAELPRTELQSAPFAMRASVADVAIADDGDWSFFGTGNVQYPGDIFVGGGPGNHDLGSEIVIIQSESEEWSAGVLNSASPADADFFIGTSQTGTDSKLRIEPDGDVGIGTANPQARLHVEGSLTATGAVSLPTASVTADMTAHEPGVAYDRANPGLTLTTGSMQDIHVVSITVPGPGYVLVNAQTYSRHGGTTGENTGQFQIDTTAGGSTLSFHTITIGPEVSPSTDDTRFPVHLFRVFTVASAGTYEYRLEGRALNASPATLACFNGGISAVYLPTAYGAVDSPQPGVPALPAELAAE